MINLSRKALAAACVLSLPGMLSAGLLRPDIDVQTYRDFADNRGVFQAGATNVTVYNSDGSVNGVIAVVPDFSGVVDYGSATLLSPSFAGTVEHVGTQPMSRHTYGARFNATGLSYSIFGDTYKPISDLTPGNDVQLFRYSKMVIDAAPYVLATDPTLIQNMPGKDIVRIGGGKVSLATAPGVIAPADPVTGTNGWLTAGFNRVDSQSSTAVTDNVNDGVTKSYTSYTYTFNMDATAVNPLQIGTQSGDSGSPMFVRNAATGRYEVVAFNSSGGGDGINKTSNLVSAPLWMQDMMASYQSPVVTDSSTGGVVTMSVTDAAGAGAFTQGASTWSYTGLANGVTSASATNAQLDATRNLVFSGAGNILRLAGNVDMGAGTMEFTTGNYIIDDGGVNTRRLNTAGYIVDAGATLTLRTTGSTGDDWRKLGTGTLAIEGSGNSAAKLSLGEGLVTLNRAGGYAVDDVLITSGRGTVRLLAANQISGDISFGHRGGTLDLYGTSLSRDVIYAMDSGAMIANTKANTTSTFTWTGSGAGLTQTFRGGFTDGGSLANGLLNVVINPTTASGSVLTLTGESSNMGGYAINGGEVVLRGSNTLHAGSGQGEDAVLGPVPTPDDWTYASIATGTITVASEAKFTLADHAALNGNVTVNAGGTFAITENLFKANAESVEGALPGTPSSSLYGHQSGTVTLNGATAAMVATISGNTDQNVVYARNITGTGSFTKNGSGMLTLTGTNTFSGVKTLSGGTLLGSSLGSLGDTTTNKWSVAASGVIAATGATAAQVAAKVTTGSTGTVALAGANPDAAPNLTGYSGLYLGAIGAQSVGTAGTSSTLNAWNGTGWNLGGGGGALTMNLKLSGSGTLNVGNGSNTGSVVLTNANNNTTTGGAAFTGAINIKPGVKLTYTDINALGSFAGGDRIAVSYGAKLGLGTGANAVTVFNGVTTGSQGVLMISGSDSNAYSFSGQGLNATALGADGTATYSGTLTAGTGGYKFGGDGALTVSSVLSGTNALSSDGQGASGGVTTLSGNNTFTGIVTVQGGVLSGATGAHTLKAGSNTAFGTGNAFVLNDGGTLDLNGKAVASGTLTGTAGSSLTNSSATTATLTVNESSATTFGGVISGAVALVKSGSGTLTLSGDNTRTGTLTVSGGTLVLSGDNSTTGAIAVSSGTLQVGSGGTKGTIGAAAVTTNGMLTFFRSDNGADMAGAIAGTGGVTYLGVGVSTQSAYIIDDASTYSGGTTLSLARANLSNGAGFGTGTVTVNAGGQIFITAAITLNNALVLSGNGWSESAGQIGALRIGTTATIAGPVTLAGDTRLGTGAGSTGTISGVISGAYNLEIGGNSNIAGNTVFTGANTYSGTTTITNGTLTVGNGGTSGTLGTGAVSVASGAKLAINRSDSITVANTVSGSGSLTQAGTGTLTLSGANTYSGGTTVTSGTLQIGAGGTSGSLGAGAIVNNATLAFYLSTNGADAASSISGSGAVVYKGTGVSSQSAYVVNDASTYTGGTTVNLSRVNLSNGSGLGTGTVTVNSGGTIYVNTALTLANNLVISGNGWLESAGQLGALRIGATSTLSGNISIAGNTRIGAGGGATATLSGIVSGAAGLEIGGSGYLGGTTVLLGANTYTGGTTVSTGTLQLGNNAATDYGATGRIRGNVTINSGATLLLLGSNAFGYATGSKVDSVAINGGTLTHAGNGDNGWGVAYTLTGGTMQTTGAGQFAFGGPSGANTSVTTLASATTSTIAGKVTLRGDPNTVVNFTVADGTAATDLAVSANVGQSFGTVGITKSGAGVMVLSGTNTYTGVTTVNGGRLVAGSNTAFGTGAVVAASGGTLSVGLRGAGRSLSNAITVNSGGVLAGTATLSGGVTLASGSSIIWEIAGTGGVAGTDFDRLTIAAGTVSLANAVLKISAVGIDYTAAYWNTSRVFDVVTKSGTGVLSAGFASLDTSGAGSFSADGSWSMTTGTGGVQQAVWTAGSSLVSDGSPQAVPEPSTYGLLGAGALAAAAMVRRRRRAA